MLLAMAKDPPRAGKREKTRRRLIKAAMEVVAREGFHSASVGAIAKRAGFSIGALYGNFAGKDELLFAVFDEHVTWFEQRLALVAEAADPGAAMAEWIGFLGRQPDQFLIFIEFWAYAVRKPRVRKAFAQRMAQMRSAVADALQVVSDKGAPVAAVPPDIAALLGLAIGRGLALEKLVSPDSVPDEVVGRLLAEVLRTA
jgi:AcrR family transcriptional regulator